MPLEPRSTEAERHRCARPASSPTRSLPNLPLPSACARALWLGRIQRSYGDPRRRLRHRCRASLELRAKVTDPPRAWPKRVFTMTMPAPRSLVLQLPRTAHRCRQNLTHQNTDLRVASSDALADVRFRGRCIGLRCRTRRNDGRVLVPDVRPRHPNRHSVIVAKALR